MSNRGKIFLGLKDNGPNSHLKFPSTSRQQEELGPKEILGRGEGDKGCDQPGRSLIPPVPCQWLLLCWGPAPSLELAESSTCILSLTLNCPLSVTKQEVYSFFSLSSTYAPPKPFVFLLLWREVGNLNHKITSGSKCANGRGWYIPWLVTITESKIKSLSCAFCTSSL